ncbi:MAG: SDR family NAD(P)-dependent oxidoreductase [Pseudomonadota bacterium]
MSHVVIVGADRGIAAGLVREYLRRGDQLTEVCQHAGDAWQDVPDVRVVPAIDVTSDAAVNHMADLMQDASIDVLIHVAGIGATDKWGQFDFDAMLQHYNLNALGPLRVVNALSANFAPGARIGIVTSRMGSLGDNQSGRMYSYRMSKAAANMLGINLYHQFRDRDVYVKLLHPGTVATQMTRQAPQWDSFTSPDESAAGLARQMDHLGPDTPPEFRHQDGTLLPW